jgi:taurine dioxygenase
VSSYRTFALTPLTPVIGARIEGLDLRQPQTEAQRAELRDALARHLVLFFRDQDMSDAQHLSFASSFGEPNVFPTTAARGLDEAIEWIEDGPLSPPKTDLWHTDVAFLREPPDVGVLCMRETPSAGGDTLWLSLYAIHDGLSPLMQALLADLEQDLHPGPDFEATTTRLWGAEVYRRVADGFQGARHPLVRIHPVTGRPALFLCGSYVRGIAGMRPDESDAVLAFLRSRLHDPNAQCRWRWQTHDVAVWDERCTNHRGLSDHFPSRRVVRRCTVGAGIPVGRRGVPPQAG